MGTAADLPLWAAFVAALAPAGALLVASIAAAIAWRSHARQKRTDRHQELWTSLTWALDQLEDPEDTYKVQLGMTVLTSLGKDTGINKADNRLLSKVNKIVASRSEPANPVDARSSFTAEVRDTFVLVTKGLVGTKPGEGSPVYLSKLSGHVAPTEHDDSPPNEDVEDEEGEGNAGAREQNTP